MLELKHSRVWEIKEEFRLSPAQRKRGKEHRKEITLSSDREGVSFITLGPATLKDNICIGEEERTKDTSAVSKHYSSSILLDGFQQAMELFYTLKAFLKTTFQLHTLFFSWFSFCRLVIGCHGQRELQVAGCWRSRLASVKETQSLKYFTSESLSYPVVSTAGSNQQSL